MSKSTYRRRFKTGRELFGERTVTEEELERMKAGARSLLQGSNEDDRETNDERQKALAESLANEMNKRSEMDSSEEEESEADADDLPEGPDLIEEDFDYTPFADTET